MPVFTIKLHLPADDYNTKPETVAKIAQDIDTAINVHGLLGGNFIVTDVSDDETAFWEEWSNARFHP